MKNKIDLVVSFDTTGSMYPVLSTVRNVVSEFVNEMFSQFSDLRIGIIAHGDYCDKDDPYTIIYRELSRDSEAITEFVRSVKSTYGGDADECYELVLNLAASEHLGWREDADKILIMIGDASPHSSSYPLNKDGLDWKHEAHRLYEQGVKVFAVHALAGIRSSSRIFYTTVADETMGVYLTLDMFNEIVDIIKATVYQQGGEERLNEFVTLIKDTGKMTKSMDRNIRRLKGEKVEVSFDGYASYGSSRTTGRVREAGKIKEMGELVPVIPGRFQVLEVDSDCDIKSFVTNMGITFKKGRGFYELSKAETVQQYKEVIIQDRETGEMFTGAQVREKLGLSPQTESGGVNERIHASAAKDYRVFIQSTSVNRKLIAGKMFLYEIVDTADEGSYISEETTKLKKIEKEPKKDKTEHIFSEVESPFEKESIADKDTREAAITGKKVSKKKAKPVDTIKDRYGITENQLSRRISGLSKKCTNLETQAIKFMNNKKKDDALKKSVEDLRVALDDFRKVLKIGEDSKDE